jgi:hypothetical protein
MNRFIGLPSSLEHGEGGGAPLAGRWWIRRCASEVRGSEMMVELEGPGWFWVDKNDGNFRVRQFVHFRASADLVGRFEPKVSWTNSVISLWFRPRDARVDFAPLSKISPEPQGTLWAILSKLAMPLPRWNVNAIAKRRLAEEATQQFEQALERGYTLIYDVERGQRDFALDLLPPGKLPEHPFQDDRSWLANERLLMAPGGAHVLGPFDAADHAALDVRITRGKKLAYRAVCAPDLRRAFEAAEQGNAARIPTTEIVDTGQVEGGQGVAELSSPDCGFYLVLSPGADEVVQADVRLRA